MLNTESYTPSVQEGAARLLDAMIDGTYNALHVTFENGEKIFFPHTEEPIIVEDFEEALSIAFDESKEIKNADIPSAKKKKLLDELELRVKRYRTRAQLKGAA